MKGPLLLIVAMLLTVFVSCDNMNKKRTTVKRIDYSEKDILDSLITSTPHSTDTLFLGFAIGMTKSDYKNHIKKLRKEDKDITYSKSNNFSSMSGNFNLGEGYTFNTRINIDESGKMLTGNGNYFLEPTYNANGHLMQLSILGIEKWNGDYGFEKPNWLESNVKENYQPMENGALKQALINNNFIEKYNFVLQKGNLIIYETILAVKYVDLKTLLFELLIKETEKEIIEEKNENIKF